MSVVIAEVALNLNKRLLYSLTAVKGIGLSRSRLICKNVGLDESRYLSDLSSDELRKLSDYITANYSGEIGSNLTRMEQKRIQEWISLGNYKGLRHRKKLPVRGQRTSSNAKTRRGKAGGNSPSSKSGKAVKTVKK
jgi:small subunit ribosomal protein S13